MKKVLIITYYWPPASSPGVFRFLKFAKYLPKYGYEPVILTVKNGSYPSFDESLLEDVDPSLSVYKTKTIEPFSFFNKLSGKKGKSLPVGIAPRKNDSFIKRVMFFIRANFFIPDARVGWNTFAFRKAKEIIKKEGIKYLITTGPPHSTHLTGLKLQRSMNVHWVADLRDPWTHIFYNQFFPRTSRTKKKDRALETSVLQNADYSIVVSQGLKDEFANRAKNIEIIPNGFDLNEIPPKRCDKTDFFVLSYVGNFKSTQNVDILWQSLFELKSDVDGFREKFRFRITGNCVPDAVSAIKKYNLDDIVTIEGHVSHGIAVERMVQSNLLLFIIPRTKNNQLILTGKLFEYLASRTPVLSVGPVGGNADALLREKSRDAMVDYESKKAFKAIILKYYKMWLTDQKQVVCSASDISEYTREGLTKKLVQVLESL